MQCVFNGNYNSSGVSSPVLCVQANTLLAICLAFYVLVQLPCAFLLVSVFLPPLIDLFCL